MNNIVVINGSPKAKDSVSGMIINQIEGIIEAPIAAYHAIKLIRKEDITAALSDILKSDILLFVFPLYVDSLPAPLIKILTLIEQANAADSARPISVYAVCNCGFFEAEHNRIALDMVENFSARAGMRWGYGIGVGGGGFVSSQSKNMAKGGPAAHIYSALRELCEAMRSGEAKDQNVFVTPKIPRLLYQLGGHLGWRQMARKYGAGKSLKAKPHVY